MTTQISDHIKYNYNGKDRYSSSTPPILKVNKRQLVPVHERIVEAEYTEDNPDISSTACWRRYIASWEIKDNKLYLLNIKGRYKLLGEDPLFADWVNGTIYFFYGQKEYVFPIDISVVIYEKELQLILENGVLIEIKIEDAKKDLDVLEELRLLKECCYDEYECIVDEI